MAHVSVTGSPADVVATLRPWLAADAEPEPLVVETSGSSGRPKRVLLPRAAVRASATASARRLGGTGRWVLVLPPTYVAGLNVLCRSLLAGHDPVLPDGGHAPAWPDWPTGEGWFTSLVPTQLHRALDDPAQVAALARAHTVLLGGGPVDPALRERATAAGIRTVATYGSAETVGGCVYDGRPLDGVAVALDPDGRIRIGGPTLFDGYEGDAGLTAQVLVDGWFVTADAGRLDHDGRLQVLGRVDDVVVSGGVNVPGPAVAARLRTHPAVRAVEVLGVPDEEWGNRLVAFVVLDRAQQPDRDVRAWTRDWVAAEHPRSWAPAQVVEVEEIPMLANGKTDRLRLRALVDAAPARARGER